MYLGLDKG